MEALAIPLASDVSAGTALIIIALLVLPVAAVAFATSGPAFRQLGKGPFAIEQELPRPRSLGPTPVSRKEQETEVRQMLEAKSYRRQQRGEEPLDVEAEMERLLGPPGSSAGSLGNDAELREEVRQLVIARNERRMRKGQAPLDVEQEIKRQLRDLENLGQ
jgi:hypothetical protein